MPPKWMMFAGAAATAALSGLAQAGEIASGGFDVVKQQTAGAWSIIEDDGERFILLSDDFRTKGAPDLKFFLHKRAAAEVTATNATDGLFLAELDRHTNGAARLAISGDFDPADYDSLVLHCEKFAKLWAAGALSTDRAQDAASR